MHAIQAPPHPDAPSSKPPTRPRHRASTVVSSFASVHAHPSAVPVLAAVPPLGRRKPLSVDLRPSAYQAAQSPQFISPHPSTSASSSSSSWSPSSSSPSSSSRPSGAPRLPPVPDNEPLLPHTTSLDRPHQPASSSSSSSSSSSRSRPAPELPTLIRRSLTAAVKGSPIRSSPDTTRHGRSASSGPTHCKSRINQLRTAGSRGAHTHARSPTMPNMPLHPPDARPPEMTLKLDGVAEDYMDLYPYEDDTQGSQTSKKSPSGFSSFFGWSAKSQSGPDSPATTFSLSPDSPRNKQSPSQPAKAKPNGLDIPAANSLPSYFNVPGTPLLSHSPQMNAHVEELERELREVSSELAASIQREMDLEDEVERYKAESFTGGSSENRRTSDYYSDSGTSSIRFPIGDPETKLEQVETLRRKAEQERASLKVRMAERLQEELRRRRDLEEQVHQLEDQVSTQSRAGSVAETPRIKELSLSLEDAKRRLTEERQVKENFEDLLAALRGELEKYRTEADNLRDEVVPLLRARLEVLETEAADTERLMSESTRMQREIQQLRTENQTLANARRRSQQDLSLQQGRFPSIAEDLDNVPPLNQRVGLTRSNSLARSTGINSKRGSLSRSNSVKDRSGDQSPRDAPAAGNPVKELEEQRDALHKALRLLLTRQELQQKDFQRRIKELESERDAALNLTPRRTAFHKEVTGLRAEVNALRHRADDALEQKLQCEKGLSGLRMDLDRAQQETGSLRDLLREHDITIPEIRLENEPLALDKAYNELRTTHALSLLRVKQLESNDADSLGAAGAEAERTLDLLRQSISDAEAERDFAQKEAEEYRKQARSLQQSEMEHLGREQSLSKELFAAATRMDELSQRIQQQLQANGSLRSRLTLAITRGEREQQRSTEQIIELERRLKTAEDKVMIAQQSSEDAIARHEDEVQAIKESHTSHLRRTRSGLLSPAAFSPKLPSSPVFAQRSPRLSVTTSGPAMTFAEATKTELLEKRVEELEKALRDADYEMEEVVGRMNAAQMEVADLQFERDEAMRKTRRLQADIVAEREKVKTLMATTA